MEILIFKDVDDFLAQMEALQNQYNTINHYYKYIKDIKDIRNQLKYLKKTHLLVGYGFDGEKNLQTYHQR